MSIDPKFNKAPAGTLLVSDGSNWIAGNYTTTYVSLTANIGVYEEVLTTTSLTGIIEADSQIVEHTIVSGNFPTSPTFGFATSGEYGVILIVAGKNNEAATRTLNYQTTFNGINAGASGVLNVASNLYYSVGFRAVSTAVEVGDIIGVKLWGSTSTAFDYRAIRVYIMPLRHIISGNEFGMQVYLGSIQWPVDTVLSTAGYTESGAATNIAVLQPDETAVNVSTTIRHYFIPKNAGILLSTTTLTDGVQTTVTNASPVISRISQQFGDMYIDTIQ